MMAVQLFDRARGWARLVRRDALALWLALRDPRTPWYARTLAALVVAYVFSPIDLIPDFIPVIGYLDDIIVVPLGILAVVALMPAGLMDELRVEAETRSDRPTTRAGIVIVGLAWLAAAIGLGWLAWSYLAPPARR